MSTTASAPSSRQLGALIALRWRMIRSRPTRIAIAALCILPLVFIAAGFASLYVIPKEQALNVALATPTLYLGFLILAVLAPLVSGGGYELYPGEQLVSFPVRAATVFRGTLVLAPVNLAWILNVIGLFVVTAYAAGPLKWGPTCRASAIVFAYILVASAFGHVAGWFVMGVRQTRRGRIVTNLLGLLLLALGLYVIWADLVIDLLDKSPTRSILD